jgi:hypothetical protein
MAEGRGGGLSRWVWGCGAGCLVVLILLIAGAVLLWFGLRQRLEAAKPEMQANVKQFYKELKARGEVPEEHRPTLDQLEEVSQRQDASVYVVMAIHAFYYYSFADGSGMDEGKTKLANELLDYVEENPDRSLRELSELMRRHPELQTAFQEMLRRPEGLFEDKVNSDAAPRVETEDEGPIPESEPGTSEPAPSEAEQPATGALSMVPSFVVAPLGASC